MIAISLQRKYFGAIGLAPCFFFWLFCTIWMCYRCLLCVCVQVCAMCIVPDTANKLHIQLKDNCHCSAPIMHRFFFDFLHKKEIRAFCLSVYKLSFNSFLQFFQFIVQKNQIKWLKRVISVHRKDDF